MDCDCDCFKIGATHPRSWHCAGGGDGKRLRVSLTSLPPLLLKYHLSGKKWICRTCVKAWWPTFLRSAPKLCLLRNIWLLEVQGSFQLHFIRGFMPSPQYMWCMHRFCGSLGHDGKEHILGVGKWMFPIITSLLPFTDKSRSGGAEGEEHWQTERWW